MDRLRIVRLAKLTAVFGFTLPWLLVSCGGSPLAPLSGFRLIMGDAQAEGPGHAPSFLLAAGLFVIVAGLVLGVLVRRRAGRLRAMLIAALLALGLCLGGVSSVMLAWNRQLTQSTLEDPETHRPVRALDLYSLRLEPGFWLTCAALLTAAVTASPLSVRWSGEGQCRACGALIQTSDRYCRQCGASLTSPSDL